MTQHLIQQIDSILNNQWDYQRFHTDIDPNNKLIIIHLQRPTSSGFLGAHAQAAHNATSKLQLLLNTHGIPSYCPSAHDIQYNFCFDFKAKPPAIILNCTDLHLLHGILRIALP